MLFNAATDAQILRHGGALATACVPCSSHYGMPIGWAAWQRRPRSVCLCLLVARRLLAPLARPVFSVASIIPMIPGSYAFQTMIAIVGSISPG